jgi:transposase
VVDQLDLGPFLRGYRADGHGHPAYHPKTLLGVLLYAYATGVRSSRQIQRRCTEDLAFRVLAGNQLPDHVTIARFRVRHQQALAGFLVQSLKLCAAAGLVRLGMVALDGTKVAASAADRANRTLAKLEAEVATILREAARPTSERITSTAEPGATNCQPSSRAQAGGWPVCRRPRRGWKPRRPNASTATSGASPS